MAEVSAEFRILIVDDEPEVLRSMKNILEMSGFADVDVCSDSRQVESRIAKNEYSAITLDLSMPHVSGQELLEVINAENPTVPVVVVTAANDLETAVGCMRAGAFDYLLKPVDKNRLTTCIRRAIEMWGVRLQSGKQRQNLLAEFLDDPGAFSHIKTQSAAMAQLFRYIEVIGPTNLPVLITGETGTGKELVAEAVHKVSRRNGEFVAVNVAGLDDTMFSDTLFGHLPGAYTGATGTRAGMIKRAETGTLFLDEIGDLRIESQVKLLRLLQEGEYMPLGADKVVKTETRFVLATNRDLPNAVEDGEFRNDLYFRLRSHRITIPALRERKEDLPLLADYFLEKAFQEIGKKHPRVPPVFYDKLLAHEFPGNVRELQGVMYDLAVRNTTPTLVFEPNVHKGEDHSRDDAENFFGSLPTLPTVERAVELLIEETMRRLRGNQTEAAKVLGLDRTTLNRRLNRAKNR